ncbi:hypothetical protein D3C81_2056960 [compost metagenome]
MLLLQRTREIQFCGNGEVTVDQRAGHAVERTRQLRSFQRFENQPFRVAGDITLGSFSGIDIIFNGDQIDGLQEAQPAS